MVWGMSLATFTLVHVMLAVLALFIVVTIRAAKRFSGAPPREEADAAASVGAGTPLLFVSARPAN
jgi:hypothetical protein